MRFDARDLKPFSEPVTEAELKKSDVYFSVTFVDDAMEIPVIETIVFLGRQRNGVFRFQDIDSYQQRKAATTKASGTIFECKEDGLNNIFEYEKALDVLMRCSVRRQKRA